MHFFLWIQDVFVCLTKNFALFESKLDGVNPFPLFCNIVQCCQIIRFRLFHCQIINIMRSSIFMSSSFCTRIDDDFNLVFFSRSVNNQCCQKNLNFLLLFFHLTSSAQWQSHEVSVRCCQMNKFLLIFQLNKLFCRSLG